MTEKKISDYLPKTEILAQLAEEASELAQAALKLRRALDGKNPTPKSVEECESNLLEEAADVKVAFEAYVGDAKPCIKSRVYEEIVKTAHVKYDRWLSRLQAQEDAVPLNLANRMHWRKTEENPPSEKDADEKGCVLSINTNPGDGFISNWTWKIVATFPNKFPLWMPMPEPPKEKRS